MHDENVAMLKNCGYQTICVWSAKLINFKHASEINSGANSENAQKAY